MEDNIQQKPNQPTVNQVSTRKRMGIVGSVIAAILLVLYGYALYESGKNYDAVTNAALELNRRHHEKVSERNKVQNSRGELKSLDLVWNLYTNKKLGFSINIPKGDDIVIHENDNLVFITYPAELPKILQLIETGADDHEKTHGITWAFQVAHVLSEQEIDDFIKKEYGIECAIGDKKERKNDSGTYEYGITNAQGFEFGPDGCFVNYGTVVAYNPHTRRLIQWDFGQDISFWLNGGMGEPADGLMRDSFRFIEPNAGQN